MEGNTSNLQIEEEELNTEIFATSDNIISGPFLPEEGTPFDLNFLMRELPGAKEKL